MTRRNRDRIELAAWLCGWVLAVVLMAAYATWEADRLRRPFEVDEPRVIWLESQGGDDGPGEAAERSEGAEDTIGTEAGPDRFSLSCLEAQLW